VARLAGLLAAVVIAVPSAAAQPKVLPHLKPEASRSELTALATEASDRRRIRDQRRGAHAEAVEASAIRERLTNGDLRVGDRFLVSLT
jgi:hypothetical protein